MKTQEQYLHDGLPVSGSKKAKVLVVCDPPYNDEQWDKGLPLTGKALNLFAGNSAECGFVKNDFIFVSCAPPIPEAFEASDKKTSEFIAPFRDELLQIIAEVNPKLIIYTGKLAGKQVMGRSTQITKVRGSFQSVEFPGIGKLTVLPMLSPAHVLRRPENLDIFRTDFLMAGRLRELNWEVKELLSASADTKNYRWCTDISALIAHPPKALSCDTETTGLRWWTANQGDEKSVRCLTVQIAVAPGEVYVIPVDRSYYPKLTARGRAKVLAQLKILLENPKIRKVGHNGKYDSHILREDLGIYIDFDTDTQLMAFLVDENMQEKSLDECVRRWVPEMAGYNDEYNKKLDKENMAGVSHEDMLTYGGGDADASFRLAMKLSNLARVDAGQWNCYERIIMPAIKAFADPVELYGIKINTKQLAALQAELAISEKEKYAELIAQVPASIKRKHAEKGLSFTRDNFTRDILFTKEGRGLKPRVFTASTAKLENKADRVPSVSTKQHLPYFADDPFVAQYMEYIKLQKIRSTYVGVPYCEKKKGPTGFWQYIYQGEIHPSFILHRTVTGRAASVNPNGQNFPKRGKLAKAYRKIFVARPGYVFIETDLSQAELRIAAWEANERTMFKVYRGGGDIHAMTAAKVMGLTLEQFMKLDEEIVEQKRFQAKAVNFGFIYGAWWTTFKRVAKTDYGIDFTDEEAQEIRTAFFELYPGLLDWHDGRRAEVRKNGFVRSLHGAVRHLPSINSSEEYIKQECERQAINSPVQRFASDLGLIAMIRMVRDCDPEIMRPLMFVHDALVVEVKEEYAKQAQGWIKFYMETPPLEQWFGITSPIPIVADIAMGPNLGEMEKCKNAKAKAPPFFDPAQDSIGPKSRKKS